MTVVFLVQLLFPLAILLWLSWHPPRNWLGWVALVLSGLLVLLVSARVGMWMFPPWWVPWGASAALLLLAMASLVRNPPVQLAPSRWWAWLDLVLLVAVGAFAVVLGARALRAATPPAHLPVVELTFPLAGGTFLVVSGGTDVLVNTHQVSMTSSDPRYKPWRGNGYAVDVVGLDAWGMRASGFMPIAPKAYRIYGASVLAPCAGEVLRAVDGLPDMPIPEYDRANLAGNHVLLACGDAQVLLAHLKTGTLRVRVGDKVALRQPLGEVGNSGGSSEPHLHIHAQRPGTSDAPFSGDPLPMRFDGRFLVRGDRVQALGGSGG